MEKGVFFDGGLARASSAVDEPERDARAEILALRKEDPEAGGPPVLTGALVKTSGPGPRAARRRARGRVIAEAKSPACAGPFGSGRGWVRTSDLSRVRRALSR
jgi:hypothetical protein